MVIICLHTKFHLPSCNGSFTIKPKTKYRFHAAAMILFYILKIKNYTIEVSSNGITFVTNFVKIGQLIKKIDRGKQKQLSDLMSTFLTSKEGKEAKKTC
jgi:hypothetical protein